MNCAENLRLLPSPDPSLNRGPHFSIVVPVVFFPLSHFLKDLGVDSGPQIVCERVLILHVIVTQDAPLMQPIECGYDLLEGVVDSAPRLINVSFYFVQFHVVRLLVVRIFHICKFPNVASTLHVA